ncbi:hypothetical protein RvY_04842-2 [Ramazzottius varieornatus]|uniref:Uncharacterized protein n=1 Tax=Ramazzottius varieornatus TaxID=947166 RepID=A0A1D1UT16_RAMVA|nr:hypothetical protein RvY_04842-2 [Ramazzottius varieornatus]
MSLDLLLLPAFLTCLTQSSRSLSNQRRRCLQTDSGQKLRDNLEKAREELRKRESTPAFASADINEETTIESLPPKKVSPRLEEHVETSLVESMQSMKVATDGGHMNEEVNEAPEPSDRSDQEHTRSSRSPNTTTNYMDKKSVFRDLLQRIPDTTKSLSTLQLRDTWRSESPSAASPPKEGPKAAKVLTIEEGCELAKQHELARKEAQERHAQYVLTNFAPKSSTASQPSDSFSRAYDFYNHREPDEDYLTESEEADAEEDIDEESEPDEKEE